MSCHPSEHQSGFSLVELMIAMLLGMIVVGAAITVFLSNRQTYAATESLGRVQENVRTAFEMMSRDVRVAGGNPCDTSLPVVNILNDPGSKWWSTMGAGIIGYTDSTDFPDSAFGTAVGQRIKGTDAIELKSAFSASASVVEHNPTSAEFKVGSANHQLFDGDIVMACDFTQGSIFQITNAQPGTNTTVVHNPANGSKKVPGNCSKGLGVPLAGADKPDCTTNGTEYTYGPNSTIAKFQASRWYIGANDNGGHSLFQSSIVNNAGTIGVQTNEIAEGVDDMVLEYLELGTGAAGKYAPADEVGDWRNVVAVRISMNFVGRDAVGTDRQTLRRTVQHVVTIRNRAE